MSVLLSRSPLGGGCLAGWLGSLLGCLHTELEQNAAVEELGQL